MSLVLFLVFLGIVLAAYIAAAVFLFRFARGLALTLLALSGRGSLMLSSVTAGIRKYRERAVIARNYDTESETQSQSSEIAVEESPQQEKPIHPAFLVEPDWSQYEAPAYLRKGEKLVW